MSAVFFFQSRTFRHVRAALARMVARVLCTTRVTRAIACLVGVERTASHVSECSVCVFVSVKMARIALA